MNINDHVVRGDTPPLGGRCGTAIATHAAIFRRLGNASWSTLESDAKVTVRWYFNTPRGPAEVRDYWWNAPNEWSICAQNKKAALWLANYLRSRGIQAGVQTSLVMTLQARLA